MNLRLLHVFATVFFICAGVLVIWGMKTDRAIGVTGPSIFTFLCWAVIGVLGFGLYMLPSIIAFVRHHRECVPIFLVNLLLPGIGWIIGLIWSFSSQVDQPAPTPHNPHNLSER